jgi:hypothetical protein
MADTMGACILNHFRDTVEDPKTAKIIEFAQDIAHDHIEAIQNLFEDENCLSPKDLEQRTQFRCSPLIL